MPTFRSDEFEPPTVERPTPSDIWNADEAQTARYAAKEINTLLRDEREMSGVRALVSDEDLARYEQNETVTPVANLEIAVTVDWSEFGQEELLDDQKK